MRRATEFFIALGVTHPLPAAPVMLAIDHLLEELETLRRIRHLALSYREAQIECNWSFDAASRERRYRRCLELDVLLGIDEQTRGTM